MRGSAQTAANTVTDNRRFAKFFSHGQTEFDVCTLSWCHHQDNARRYPFLTGRLYAQEFRPLAQAESIVDAVSGGFFHAFKLRAKRKRALMAPAVSGFSS